MLYHSIVRWAQETPEKEAFRCLEESLTYADLDQRSTQLAHQLHDLGVSRGDRVGIFLNRCLDSATAVYGILKAGAAFVPLDPFAPASRNHFVIKDCQIKVLVSSDAQRRQLTSLFNEKPELQCIIGTSLDLPVHQIAELPEISTTPLATPGHPNDLAYIMYTSGTTGTPKGIMHTHFSGLSYAELSAEMYQVGKSDRIGNHSPLHFDISTFGYFTGPLSGATTVLCSDAHTKLPASLAQMIEGEQLTIWYSVPLALTQILQRGDLEKRDWSCLRWVLYGGEPFPVKHLQELMNHTPQAQWSNVYGPAEVNQCSYYHMTAAPADETPIPLGKIWDRTKALILDDDDNPTSHGEQGALLIQSDTMMQGYWNRPDLTECGFYTAEGGGKYYRTGDLVRLDAQGLLHFEGRKDRQIKTRGYRVELDEVEAALVRFPGMEEAAVFAIKTDQETILVAAIVSTSAAEDIEHRVLQHLKKLVPPYSIPSRFIYLKNLPRTPAGKVDHRALITQTENEITR